MKAKPPFICKAPGNIKAHCPSEPVGLEPKRWSNILFVVPAVPSAKAEFIHISMVKSPGKSKEEFVFAVFNIKFPVASKYTEPVFAVPTLRIVGVDLFKVV